MGEIEGSSRKSGLDKVSTGREDCREGNTAARKKRGGATLDGGVLEQLIEELKRELTYHQNQVTRIESRLEELLQLSDELNNISDPE